MIFMFEVHIAPGYSAEQYALAWERASRIIQSSPGARGTRLHRKIGHPNVLLAIASWDSIAARNAMENSLAESARRIIDEQAAFVEIKVLGEYAAPDWEVLPQDDG